MVDILAQECTRRVLFETSVLRPFEYRGIELETTKVGERCLLLFLFLFPGRIALDD
jgi:hypothetical protein